jgi:hypothetical protein
VRDSVLKAVKADVQNDVVVFVVQVETWAIGGSQVWTPLVFTTDSTVAKGTVHPVPGCDFPSARVRAD